MGKPHNCIHGSADFMAHIGEKFALGLAGLFCRLLTFHKVGNITTIFNNAKKIAIWRKKWRGNQIAKYPCTVFFSALLADGSPRLSIENPFAHTIRTAV